jgi:hypothetical protein
MAIRVSRRHAAKIHTLLLTDAQRWVVVYSVKTLDDIHTSAIVSLRFINDKGRLISIDLAVRHLLFQKRGLARSLMGSRLL